MITHEPFIGKEAEGPDIGTETLFIPSGSPKRFGYNEFFEKVISLPISRLYFGAGNDTGLVEEDVKLIDKLLGMPTLPRFFRNWFRCIPWYKILIECTVADVKALQQLQQELGIYITQSPSVEIILVLPIKSSIMIPEVQHIKFVGTKGLVWFRCAASYKTLFDDELYNTDKLFEEDEKDENPVLPTPRTFTRTIHSSTVSPKNRMVRK
jgi:hypothetical protein